MHTTPPKSEFASKSSNAKNKNAAAKKKADKTHEMLKTMLAEGRLCLSLDGEKSIALNEDLLLDYPAFLTGILSLN